MTGPGPGGETGGVMATNEDMDQVGVTVNQDGSIRGPANEVVDFSEQSFSEMAAENIGRLGLANAFPGSTAMAIAQAAFGVQSPDARGMFSGSGGNNSGGNTAGETGPGGGGNGDGPLAQPPAPAPAPVPDPVAPAQQTISAPDSPEQQAAAVQARRKKKSRPLINGGFLGPTADGVQTSTPTGPSLGTTTSLGPGAGFVRRRNTV